MLITYILRTEFHVSWSRHISKHFREYDPHRRRHSCPFPDPSRPKSFSQCTCSISSFLLDFSNYQLLWLSTDSCPYSNSTSEFCSSSIYEEKSDMIYIYYQSLYLGYYHYTSYPSNLTSKSFKEDYQADIFSFIILILSLFKTLGITQLILTLQLN